jgi:hypothetical protein
MFYFDKMTFSVVPRRNQAKFKPKFSENKIREAVVCALRLKIENQELI